jgi:ribosome-binding factor A
MPKEYSRSQRVGQLITRELTSIIRNEVRDPRVTNITITEVLVTSDLRQAKIYVSNLLDDQVDVDGLMQALEKASGFLRRQLADKIDLRHCPILIFEYDNSLKQGAEMSALIDKALNK